MRKRTQKLWSMLLTICLLLSVLPGPVIAATAEPSEASVTTPSISSPATESTIIPPEDAAPLLEEECHILRYVDEDTFASKGHIARLHAEETLSSYVFLNEDGSRTVYYMDEPVKYRDANGLVWEKDLTLRPSTSYDPATLMGASSVEGYTTTSNDVGLTIPNDPTNGIRLSFAEQQIRLIPQNGTLAAAAQVTDSTVTYPDYFGEGMSLRYTPTLDGVKEDIILKAYTGANSFSFLLETGGMGLYQDNGRYYLADSQASETRFELGDVVTFDAHGKFSVGTMAVETVTANQRYRLTLTVDEAFLTDSATTYPVTIDPTVTISNASNSDGDAIEDATIYSGAPDLNANWTYLHAGYYNSTYKVARTLFLFPGLIGSSVYQFPSEYQITSVEFHIREATGTSPVAVGLYANSSDYRWSESTITWNYTDFTLTKQYATASPGNGSDTVYDITDLVLAWQGGEEDPYMGITLKSSNETSIDKSFYATEYSTSSYRPYVSVTYDSEIELNKSVVNLAPNGTATITAETAVSGGTITWASSDTAIATVAKTGTNTCQVTAVRSGIATITATLNNGPAASCTVYVSITNGVYFIKYGSLCLSVDSGMIPGSTLTLQEKKSSGPAQFRQLWKIQHIGQHYYSIRSLYRPDLVLNVTNGIVNMASLDTSLSGSNIPSNKRWMISRTGSSYLFHFVGTASLAMQPEPGSPSGAQVIAGVDANAQYTWSLEWGPTIENQVLLINTTNGLPATNAVRYIIYGTAYSLSDFNFIASYISKSTNDQDIYLEASNSEVVSINASTDTLTGTASDEITIYVKKNGCSQYASFTLIVIGAEQYAKGVRIATVGGKQYYDYTIPLNDLFSSTAAQCGDHRCMNWTQYCSWAYEISPLYDCSLAEHTGMQLGAFLWFYERECDNAVWDIKNNPQWSNALPDVPYLGLTEEFVFRGSKYSAEDIGNILYGYNGRALGLGKITLFWGGGAAKRGSVNHETLTIAPLYGDDENDHDNIEKGWDLFNSDYPDYPEIGYDGIPLEGWMADIANIIYQYIK